MKKKLFTIALALCMVFTMIPRGVFQAETAWADDGEGQTSVESEVSVQNNATHTHCICGATHKDVGDHTQDQSNTNWTGVSSLREITTAGNYYLTENVTLSATWEPVDDTVLCLSGHTITANGEFDAIEVQADASFTLTDCEPEGTAGKITHVNGKTGSGVKVEEKAVFNMYGGNISDNMAETNGGGVYVGKNGAFTMYGGIIEKNNGVRGGGLHNAGGTFTMTGGTIRANSAAQGAGVYSSNFAPVDAKFDMSGGTIIDNTASYYGGGVLTQCESKMTGGTITGNKAKDGGGLYIFSYLFDMTGGTITKNTAESNGGGVCNSGGNFSMSGVTTISYNEAANYGGGVYNWKTFSMNGGTITNNTAPMGGGVFHAWDSATTTTLSGAPIVTGNGNGNTENNLYIYCGTNSKPVTASGLTTGAKIGISASRTDTGALITGTTNTDYFFSDLNSCKLESSGNGLTLAADSNVTGHTNHCICVGNAAGSSHQHDYNVNWQAWTETTKLPKNVGSYYLTQNVEISEAWQPANGTVLCLNGKNITANGAFDVIKIPAGVTFTLTDCEPNSTRGNITHAKDSNNAALSGSGVSVKAGAAFNMYGGNITGNEVTIGGSGVSVEAGAAFNMHGGSITKNTALNNIAKGGGVNNYGIFTMTGGTISGNQGGTANGGGGGGVLNAGTFTMSGTAVIGGTNAEDANIGYNGGGVYNYNTGQFNFNGGTIIGNEANKNGGGVYNEQGSPTFTMTGGIIKKNKAKNGGGVAVNNSATFTMNGGTIGDTNSNDANTVTNEGGGVYVLSGIFNMNTGNIIGNTAVRSKTDEDRGWGGGVYISTGTFTMTGGTIGSNRAIKEQGSAGALGAGGGVYNNRSGTFTMSGGNISNNTSDSHGGGVYNSGTFTMSDTAAISGNTVTNETCYGGGVFNYSSFTMNGGTIGGLNEDDANTAGFGGGLYHGDGEAQLNGGMIQGNIAAKSGGGVFYTKNITLKNVTITGNTAKEDGGGAWMGVVDDAVMTVGGTTTIIDNKDKDGKANNVGLRMGKSLTADASLSPSARIGITTLTSNEKTLVKNSTDTTVFTSDMSGYKLIDDGNSGLKLAVDDGSTPTQTGHKHYLCGKTHTEVGDHTSDEETKFTAWTRTDSLPDTKGHYYLENNVTLDATWKPADGTVLCLNGKNITMKNPDGMTDEVDVIKVSGHFTLTDCKTGDAQGKITHATDASSTKCEGKGVKVLGDTFDMFGGIISGNTTNYDIGGGGVSVEGVSDTTKASIFKLYGGKISGNTAKSGGGVHVRRTVWCGPSEFRMYGGSITNNNADSDAGSYGVGGGVYVSWTSKFIMDGGTISENTATQFGGGVYASALARENAYDSGGAAELKFSGTAMITGNKAGNENSNVYLDSDTSDSNYETVSVKIAITKPLTGTIGVTTKDLPTAGRPVTIATGAAAGKNYRTNITSDKNGYEIGHASKPTELILKVTGDPDPAPVTAPTISEQPKNLEITYGKTGNFTVKAMAATDTTYKPLQYQWYKNTTNSNTGGTKIEEATSATYRIPTNIAAGKYYYYCEVTAEREDNGQKTKATTNAAMLIVSKAPVTVTVNNQNAYINGTLPANSYKADGLVNGDQFNETSLKYEYKNAKDETVTPNLEQEGTYTIVISGLTLANANNYDVTYKPGTLTITQKSSSGGGGGSSSRTDVTTTETTDSKVTSSPSQVKNETKTDANGNQVTTATVTVSSANQREILRQAKANKSGEIIIKVSQNEVKDGAKLKMNLDKSFIESIVNDTDAKLTIQTPSGEKTFTQEELKKLAAGATGNTVTLDPTSTGTIKPTTPTEPTTPTNPSADKNAKLVKGVENTTIVLKSKLTKDGKVLLTWTKSKGYKVDKFEVYRSVKRHSGYGKKAFFTTKDGNRAKYLNTKSLKKGKTYYYKVRGVRTIDGQKSYTQWSNKAWRTVK